MLALLRTASVLRLNKNFSKVIDYDLLTTPSRATVDASTSGLVVKSNVAIVGPRVRFSASAILLLRVCLHLAVAFYFGNEKVIDRRIRVLFGVPKVCFVEFTVPK